MLSVSADRTVAVYEKEEATEVADRHAATAPTTPIRVLHVDDEPGYSEMVADFLERGDREFQVTRATSGSEGMRLLESTQFDCVVSDYVMPETNGLQFLNDVRETYPDLPFILLTKKGREDITSDALSAGVTDYVQKEDGTGQYKLLAHRITNAVDQYRFKRDTEARLYANEMNCTD